MVKIYTKRGDKGETSLIGGKRVSKSSQRIEAYGHVDELNSCIGVVISFTKDREIKELLAKIQSELFIVGSDLADPSYPKNTENIPRISETMIGDMEKSIDKYEAEVGSIGYFILPGGSKEASLLHLARGIARRAERSCVDLASKEKINPSLVVYLNRISDLLFVLARVMNKRGNVSDVAWRG